MSSPETIPIELLLTSPLPSGFWMEVRPLYSLLCPLLLSCIVNTRGSYARAFSINIRPSPKHFTDTIITSFPKRYGRNKPDPSAVHKSIRLRLKLVRKNEIRSIYDLALIVIDECSKVFFDRTKTADRQPQMMDLFAEAIGNVVRCP